MTYNVSPPSLNTGSYSETVGDTASSAITISSLDAPISLSGFGPFAEGHHHLVVGERVLDPLLRHEVGVADQQYLHSPHPRDTPV